LLAVEMQTVEQTDPHVTPEFSQFSSSLSTGAFIVFVVGALIWLINRSGQREQGKFKEYYNQKLAAPGAPGKKKKKSKKGKGLA